MPATATPPPARPAVVLGLTMLVLGLTFALPIPLIPDSGLSLFGEQVSAEVANVYACAAWAGWAHFLFAFRGQSRSLRPTRESESPRKLVIYAITLAAIVAALIGVRGWAGVGIFSAVVWVYFIDHFLKAENVFEGKPNESRQPWSRWLSSYQPLIAFGWLSIVLLDIGGLTSTPWLLWLVSLVLSGLVLFTSGLRQLGIGDVRPPLLALLFIAEALIWGTFTQYGGKQFNIGVYVFHIAAGSYYHYFGSYYFALSKSQGRDKLLGAPAVVSINLLIIALGIVTVYSRGLTWLTPMLAPQWFTLWVAAHLVSSDVFPLIKSQRRQVSPRLG